jgi:hypothetical protein
MQAGHTEVTYSRVEKVGLPNWSFMTITASAKTSGPITQHAEIYNFLFAVVEHFVKERVEAITRSLNLWAGLPSTDPGEKASIVPQGIDIGPTEVSFTVKETVGLPEKSSLDIFASSKALADVGVELTTLEHVAGLVMTQMAGKRDIVLANPRPWTAQK